MLEDIHIGHHEFVLYMQLCLLGMLVIVNVGLLCIFAVIQVKVIIVSHSQILHCIRCKSLAIQEVGSSSLEVKICM